MFQTRSKVAIIASVTLIALSTFHYFSIKKNNDLPRVKLPEMEFGILYDVKMTTDNPPFFAKTGRITGVQQDYLVNMQPGFTYWFESSVGWQHMEASLSADGKIIERMMCGYNARCNFGVTPANEMQALLRISGEPGRDDQRFNFIINAKKSPVYSSPDSTDHSVELIPAQIPAINTNIIYNGEIRDTDLPLHPNNKGYIQDYRISLLAGDNIRVKITPEAEPLNVHLVNNELTTLKRDSSDDEKLEVCFNVKVDKDGFYLLRIFTPKSPQLKNSRFTLEVSRDSDKVIPCL